MITAAQIRGARAMIGLSLADLAKDAKLPPPSLEAIENGAEDARALPAIKAALEARGILFLANGSQDGGGPGIRLKSFSDGEGTRPENLNATNDD